MDTKFKVISIYLVVITSFINASDLLSQSDCSEIALKTPEVLIGYQKTGLMNKIYSGRIGFEDAIFQKKVDKCWVVYSDRKDNPLFMGPKGIEKRETLNYMDRFYVKKIKGSWLLLADDDVGFPEKGWVNASQLILTRNTLLNKKSTPRKAMILVSLEGIKNNSARTEDLLEKKFYNNPSSDAIYDRKSDAKKFQIYYILKDVGGSVLLSTKDEVQENEETESINVKGWISKINVTFWDHRVCLEETTSSRAIKVYGSKKIPLLRKKEDVEMFLNTQVLQEDRIVKSVYLNSGEKHANEMRMPILEHLDGNVKKVASIARLDGSSDNEKEKNVAVLQRKLNDLKSKKEHVDILFVVDGTISMSRYYNSIAKSISKIIKGDKIRSGGNLIRFGLAVYRDYPDGKKLLEVEPLTADYEKIIAAVKETKCFSSDKNLPEAMYNGLINGIEKAGFNPSYSNVVVLIGDAGNHEPDPEGNTLVKVINTLYKYEASLIAFQVNYAETSGGSFDKFNYDAQDLIKKTAQKYLQEGRPKFDYNSKAQTFSLSFPGKEEDQELYMFGKFTHAEMNVPMNVSVLENNLYSSLKKYLDRSIDIRNRFEKIIGGDQGVFSKTFENMLRKEGFTDEQINLLKREGEFTAKAFVPISCYDTGYDCFDPVVFLSQTEKDILNQTLNDVGKRGSTSQTKEGFKQALLSQCMTFLGDVNTEHVLDKTMNEIWDVILGIPFGGSATIKNMKLRNMDKMDDEEFSLFFENFKFQADKFTKEVYENRKFKLAGTNFYWIPLEDFPGSQ